MNRGVSVVIRLNVCPCGQFSPIRGINPLFLANPSLTDNGGFTGLFSGFTGGFDCVGHEYNSISEDSKGATA